MTDPAGFFRNPATKSHRLYEAMRMRYVERVPAREVAKAFGFPLGTFYNLRTRFQRDPGGFFVVSRAAAAPSGDGPGTAEARNRRILELRKQELSTYDIARQLERDGTPCSVQTVSVVLRQAKLPKLPRRTHVARLAAADADTVAKADRRKVDWRPRRFRSDFGGLFLFAASLAKLLPDDLLEQCGMPGSDAIPAGCAMRALLALKLYGIGRPSQVTPEVPDPGLALFAGLNIMPKRSTLTEYTCRTTPDQAEALMRGGLERARQLRLPRGKSFDLDFHTIPYHGDQALMEKHYVSRRSRRQRGVLAFLARDADARVFCYANATVRKADAHTEVLRFIDWWKAHTGACPRELVFDGGLTTYATLAEINRRGIRFLTLRRRAPNILRAIQDVPETKWKRVTLTNVGRAYRTPRTLSQRIRLRDYPGTLRQVAVKDLGHEDPVLLLTNSSEPVPRLIDRYARRMVIENAIADAIDFFHMDALSATVPMKIDLDLQLTLLANILYRLLGRRLGTPYDTARAQTLFRNFVRASATIEVQPKTVTVRFGRRANNPYLRVAKFEQEHPPIPWLGNRRLHMIFG